MNWNIKIFYTIVYSSWFSLFCFIKMHYTRFSLNETPAQLVTTDPLLLIGNRRTPSDTIVAVIDRRILRSGEIYIHIANNDARWIKMFAYKASRVIDRISTCQEFRDEACRRRCEELNKGWKKPEASEPCRIEAHLSCLKYRWKLEGARHDA